MNTQTYKRYFATKELIIEKEIQDNNKLMLKAWKIRAKKPFIQEICSSEEVFARYESKLIAWSLDHIKGKEQAKLYSQITPEKMSKIHAGMIFYSSRGYEQTHINFYQVIEVKEHNLFLKRTLCKVGQDGKCTAEKDQFLSNEIIEKKIQFYGDAPFIVFSEYETAKEYDGTPLYFTYYH